MSGVVAVVAGCSGSGPSSSTSSRPGQTGTSFLVTVSRQTGGEVTSGDGRIKCGTTGTLCGPVSYGWTATVMLTATPDAGNMFGAWAGDCWGRSVPGTVSGTYLCSLDTSTTGADKFVAGVFGEAGRTQHENFTDHTIHGPAFLAWKANQPDTFECTYCHGTTYAGMGTAPSCNDCHAKNGHPDWLNDCTFCHGAPPPPPPPTFPTATHPTVSSDLKSCTTCHPDTVDANGAIIAGGKHMNGVIDGGHPPGFAAPGVHGREFFAIASTGTACQTCHGTTYGAEIVPVGTSGMTSCNGCHAAAGWAQWQTNCSFCHGVKTAATQAAPYDVAARPTWAAPPDAIAQRLDPAHAAVPDRTGAHTIHLAGSAFAGPFRCGVCHAVPTTLTHISGKDVRAAVTIDAPGGTGPDAGAYDTSFGTPTSGTCATYCHDPQLLGNRSPAWSATGLQCNGCHALPPQTDAHLWASSDLRECAGCHPDTMNADGTINVAGGKHLNGTIDHSAGHGAGFALPANHGPQALDFFAGSTTALQCGGCHGTALTYCTNCHSSAASGSWQGWKTNCTFCHGTRKPDYTTADLVLAAPPDGVAQRLGGAFDPFKTGNHGAHLNGNGSYPQLPCATCHTVPGDVSHISVERVATVTFRADGAFPALNSTQLAALPTPFTAYDYSTGECTGYCHGSTMRADLNIPKRANWWWDTYQPGVTCTDCHGNPPPSGKTISTTAATTGWCGTSGRITLTSCSSHIFHMNGLKANGYDSCGNCHYGSATTNNTARSHISGVADIVFSGNAYTKPVTGTWDATAKSCAASCHSSQTPRTWY